MEVGGTVAAEDGRPLSGVDVYLLAASSMVVPSGAPARGRTGAGGAFALKRPEAEALDLVAASPGYRPAHVPAASAGRGHRLTLSRGGTLAGTVTDDLGRPVAGAMITGRSAGSDLEPPRGKFLPWPGAMAATFARTLSGPDGRFVLTGLGDGDLELRAEKAGWTVPGGYRPGFRAGGPPAEIVLPRPFTAEVLLLDAETGRPAPAVPVRIEVGTGAASVAAEGRSDADGLARVVLPFPASAPPAPAATVVAFSERRGAGYTESVPLAAIEEGRGYVLRLSAAGLATVRIAAVFDIPPPEDGIPRWMILEFRPAAGPPVQRWAPFVPAGYEVQIPAGRYDSVVCRGRWPGDKPVPVAESGRTFAAGTVEEMRLVLRRGADLVVEAQAEGETAPLRGKITVTLPNGGPAIDGWYFHGAAAFPDLPPGAAKVRAEIQGFAPVEADVVLTRGQKTDCRLRLGARSPPGPGK